MPRMHSLEAIVSGRGVEGALFCTVTMQFELPEALRGVQSTEVFGTCHLTCYLMSGRYLIMFSFYAVTQIFWVHAHM